MGAMRFAAQAIAPMGRSYKARYPCRNAPGRDYARS
jgi:hypothetical protein